MIHVQTIVHHPCVINLSAAVDEDRRALPSGGLDAPAELQCARIYRHERLRQFENCTGVAAIQILDRVRQIASVIARSFGNMRPVKLTDSLRVWPIQ